MSDNEIVREVGTPEPSRVAIVNREIKRELNDPAVVRALLATTFKKMDEQLMRQALLEAMLRGFTFQDFLQKNLYAVKYGQGYNLMTSIDYARKVGMRGGIIGKSAPTYTTITDDEGKERIESCSVTVYKRGGHPDGYTATVFFDEYYVPGTTYDNKYTPSMWDKKPRTMIAKVAEMHAQRMACPEELSQVYIEDEFHAERRPSRMADAPGMVDTSNLTMGAFLQDGHENNETTDPKDEAETVAADGSGELKTIE